MMVHSAFRRVAEIARRGAASTALWICVVVAVAAISFFAGAASLRHQTWPFGFGYYAGVRRLFTLPPPTEIGAPQASVVDSTFHRMRTRLFAGIAEGQIEGIKTEGRLFKFLHFGLATGELSFGEIDLDTGDVVLRRAGTVDKVNRATGLFRSPADGKLYVSYVTVDATSCASMKLDEIELTEGAPLRQIPLFQTTCIRPPRALYVSGGRIQIDSTGRLYLTVGDFGRGDLAEDPTTSFGKIFAGRPGEPFTVHSRGHRNSQGLLWDQEFSRLLATEHGPQGGDEINLIVAGADYGWPRETYGRKYPDLSARFVWSENATYGRHDRYTKPLYSYVPSIGIAQIRKMPRDASEFAHWRGQYFVAGMAPRSRSLIRVVIEGDRVMLNEPLPLGRIRDFVFTETGVIVASRPDGLLVIRNEKDMVE